MAENEEVVPIEKYEELQQERDGFLNMARQLQADINNLRKRTREELEKGRTDILSEAFESIFDALDSFKKARKIISDRASLVGIKLIEEEMLRALKKFDIQKIEALNKPFNPELHNAIALVNNMKEKPNIVIEEVQAGYVCHGKVLRYSKVIVSR